MRRRELFRHPMGVRAGNFPDQPQVHRRHGPWLKIKLNRLPNDCIKHSVYSSFIDDRAGILMRELIGVDTQMWSSDIRIATHLAHFDETD
jgi:hypothetical protein